LDVPSAALVVHRIIQILALVSLLVGPLLSGQTNAP